MTFGERVLALRTEKGMTQDELALAVGYKSRSTIAKIESGERDPHQSMIAAIAKALGTTPAYLMGWEDEKPNKIQAKIPFSIDNMEPVPLVGAVAAGQGCFADDNISEYIPTDRDILKEGYEHFWLEVKGDSMEPELHEKDLVLVRKQDTLDKECFAVVNVDAEDGVVKLVNIETERITLTSLNRYYPPRVFVREEMNRVRLIGPVLEVKRRFM